MSFFYTGTVRHRRFSPKQHSFTYPVFMALLDLDHLEEAMGASRLLGFNRFNWAGFNDRDHLGDPSLPLKARFKADAESQGFAFPEGAVQLLTNLRFWGFCFNPVSYIYAHDGQGRLALIGAEVTNTPWKERIVYWMKPGEAAKGWSFDVAKAMHVSPFMPMALRYRWSFTQPGQAHTVRMAMFQGEALVFDADLDLERSPWTSREIRRVLFHFPLHTFKVITAIHWEALKLWLKHVPIFTHPAKSDAPTF
jgi:hypothetical protein